MRLRTCGAFCVLRLYTCDMLWYDGANDESEEHDVVADLPEMLHEVAV